MENIPASEWYINLIKPSWAPPAYVFGPVWTVLYFLIGISYGYVFYLYVKEKVPFAVILPLLLNLFFNFAFSPLQFGLQNNFLALIDILFIVVTLAWSFRAVFPHVKWFAYINIPYFLWVAFATILQSVITYLNW